MNEGEWQKMKDREEKEMKELKVIYEKKLKETMVNNIFSVAYLIDMYIYWYAAFKKWLVIYAPNYVTLVTNRYSYRSHPIT